MTPPLQPSRFEALAGFADDDALAAWAAFRDWARAAAAGAASLRAAQPASERLMATARAALAAPIDTAQAARRFFVERFRPWRVCSGAADGAGFLTGYYEPLIDATLAPSAAFPAPVLARPDDLGTLRPYPDRAAIEARGGKAVAWLADEVEVFFAQVQGSARLRLADGRMARLVYDGRNGQPYTSIGRLLIEAGAISEADMSLSRLKAWLRAKGLKPGDIGRSILQRNRSYVFFRLETGSDLSLGPIGGAGIALTALRSIAVDRAIWSYGLPFWIEAEMPWAGEAASPFRRLTIAHDTGSAIVGQARADLFFGGGEAAGARAGAIRHRGQFAVLLPVGDGP